MQLYPPTIILRHRRENLKKCTLRGLEDRSDFIFFTYPQDRLPSLKNHIVLVMDREAEPLSRADAPFGLFIIDATWRYAEVISKQICAQTAGCRARSLPQCYSTAYPRRQLDCPDPKRGLASIEAIYIAHFLMNRSVKNLLDHYHWKDQFLESNSAHF